MDLHTNLQSCLWQAFGGAGVSQDTPLAYMYRRMRTLRLADGPDEVHCRTLARMEMRKQAKMAAKLWAQHLPSRHYRHKVADCEIVTVHSDPWEFKCEGCSHGLIEAVYDWGILEGNDIQW